MLVDQSTLCAYVAYLARSLKPSSLPGYLNIIHLLHVERGLPNPLQNNWEIGMIKRGISRQLGAPPVQKLPLTVEILIKLHSMLD